MTVLQQFFERVKAHLQANNALYAPFRFDLLDAKTESIAFRYIPSAAAERYYLSPVVRNLQFQLLVKSTDQLKAVNALDKMRGLLQLRDGALEDTTFTLIRCEVYGEPQFVEVTNNKEYIYTALFSVEVQEK